MVTERRYVEQMKKKKEKREVAIKRKEKEKRPYYGFSAWRVLKA
jgi:hypothetical protein